MPLTEEAIRHASELSYEESRLLSQVKEQPRVSVAHLIELTVTSEESVANLLEMLKKLIPFGIESPNSQDSFLGITLQQMLS